MKKRKGELPSGNIRRQVFVGYELVYDEHGCLVVDENGNPKKKRKYVSVTGENVREVEKKKAEIIAGTKKTSTDMTLRDAIVKYIDSSESLLSPSTIRGYDTVLRFGFQNLLNEKISSLTNDMVRDAINLECQRPKSKGGKPISAKTVKNEWGLISAVINMYAPELQLKVSLPQVDVTKHDISDPSTIYELFKGSEIELPVLLAMWLSFTMSEIKGLTKSKSLSKDGKYISIKEVMVVDKYGAPVVKTKGKKPSRNRTLRLPPYIKKLIDEVDGDVIVPRTARSIQNRFVTDIKNAGLPHMTFHDLRHVNASVMDSLAIPMKQAQARGGWSSPAVMQSVYQQAFSSERKSVDDKIDGYFDKIIGGEKVDKKYLAWLTLYDLQDNAENKKAFLRFMQHECHTIA